MKTNHKKFHTCLLLVKSYIYFNYQLKIIIYVVGYYTLKMENEQSIIICIKIEKIEGKNKVIEEYMYILLLHS